MMNKRFWNPVFANDLDAWIPEVWAMESLMLLYENTVAAQLIHTDFSNEVASVGDTVNTRRPAKFTAKRKVDTDDVVDQNASAENVAVKLDQHLYVTFIIKDGEESKGMGVLRDTYLAPAVQAIAQSIDEVVLGQRFEFMGHNVGKLSTSPGKAEVISAQTAMDNQLVPLLGRNFLISPTTKGALLNVADFVNAEKVGDGGAALRSGSLGQIFGFNFYMSQNIRNISATTVVTGAVNTSGFPAGTTTIDVDGLTGALIPGSWLTVAGDMTPQLIIGSTGGGTPSDITISPGLAYAVLENAVVTIYDAALVDNGGGYGVGYNKELTIDSAAIAPRTGQLISSGVASFAAAKKYGAMSTPTTTSLLLNRSLDAAVNNDDVLGMGPAGNYNFAFHRNAISLVTRPLVAPAAGTGAISGVAADKGFAIRVTITYDGKAQGHRVTVDVLAGVKTLDTELGVVMFG